MLVAIRYFEFKRVDLLAVNDRLGIHIVNGYKELCCGSFMINVVLLQYKTQSPHHLLNDLQRNLVHLLAAVVVLSISTTHSWNFVTECW